MTAESWTIGRPADRRAWQLWPLPPLGLGGFLCAGSWHVFPDTLSPPQPRQPLAGPRPQVPEKAPPRWRRPGVFRSPGQAPLPPWLDRQMAKALSAVLSAISLPTLLRRPEAGCSGPCRPTDTGRQPQPLSVLSRSRSQRKGQSRVRPQRLCPSPCPKRRALCAERCLWGRACRLTL